MAFAISSALASTIPRTSFWLGHIKTQTLKSIIVPIQDPKPIASYPGLSKKASTKPDPNNPAPAIHVTNAAHLNHNNARGATCFVIPEPVPSAAASFNAGTCTKLK